MLDVGGNSGEFVLQICRKNPAILATVFDLPLVCEIGLEHIQPQPEADRITFVKGNAVYDNLPTGYPCRRCLDYQGNYRHNIDIQCWPEW